MFSCWQRFIHINPEGKVEACPFAPFSDSSLTNLTLVEALQSPLMKKIRDQHHLLTETKGGCALWNQKETFFPINAEIPPKQKSIRNP